MNKNTSYGMYAIALAIIVVGALALGVNTRSLGTLAFVLVCPLMMFFMMRGMGGTANQTRDDARPEPDKREHHETLPK